MTVICRCDATGNQEDPQPASKRVDDVKCRECSGPATRGECHSVISLGIRRATQWPHHGHCKVPLRYVPTSPKVGGEVPTSVQTGPGAHPASCTMGTGSFQGVKRPGRDVEHSAPSRAEVKINKSTAITLLPLWALVACYRVYFNIHNIVDKKLVSVHKPVPSMMHVTVAGSNKTSYENGHDLMRTGL
jgi:hypothetical protein